MHGRPMFMDDARCAVSRAVFPSFHRPMIRLLAFFVAAATAAAAPEIATFDSAGGLTSVVNHGSALAVHARLMAVFDGGVEVELQPHDQRTPITRDGLSLSWKGTVTCPNGAVLDFSADWRTQTAAEVELTVSKPGGYPLLLRSIDYVVDLPREVLVGGVAEGRGIDPVALLATRPDDAALLRATAAALQLRDAAGGRRLDLEFDQARPVELVDRWDGAGRSYRLRVRLHSGVLLAEPVRFTARFRFDASAVEAPPVRLTVDPAEPWQEFDGYGANLCWAADNPETEYILRQLHPAWSRHELKAILWDLQHDAPDRMLTDDFARIRALQQAGTPWIISLWRLPERFYTDPNRAGFGTFGRKIAGERWPELLDLVGGYLLHLKAQYGAEPDLFSFNEPDLGVSIGLTPEEQCAAVKRFGELFARLGLKTRFLLGDTANPRDSHKYVLATAADAGAMRHVGALSFHSWGGGTPEQYRAWAEVAAWLRLPLIVGEAGTDPGAWKNRNYDSYAYGLGEMRQTFEVQRAARPQASLYWQFTGDYALVRTAADGTVGPTGRFWLMKQLTELTPRHGHAIASSSDQPEVLVNAFARGAECVVHVLNLGPATTASIAGLPAGSWRTVTTTEETGFAESAPLAGPPVSLALPARCLVTLVRVAVAPAGGAAP